MHTYNRDCSLAHWNLLSKDTKRGNIRSANANAALNRDTIIEAKARPLAFPAKLWKAALKLRSTRGMDREIESSRIIGQNDKTIKSKLRVCFWSGESLSVKLISSRLWWKERKRKWRAHVALASILYERSDDFIEGTPMHIDGMSGGKKRELWKKRGNKSNVRRG